MTIQNYSIGGFKCATLRELEMVLQAGGRKAILSYPQCQESKIERLIALTSSYPDAWIATIVSKACAAHRGHLSTGTQAIERRCLTCHFTALILTQVVDRYPDTGTITTDLGSKGISSDLPVEERAYLPGQDTAKLVSQSEEHEGFRFPGELPRVGDYLLAVPGHICPTTIRYPGIHVIDTAGEVVDYYVHTSRDRL